MINLIPSRQLQQQQPQSETGDRGSDHGDNRGFFSDDERGKVLFGVASFLISESLIFLAFIVAYVALRLSSDNWLPAGVSPPKLDTSTIIHSVVLVSSSLVIYLAERALARRQLNRFRLLWLTTSAMGAYFLSGEVQDWLKEKLTLSTGEIGGPFYIITGFHALHVTVGILLQTIMLVRSFIPHNYEKGHYGVTAVSLFWHFVDGIWVVVFSIFYLW
ncbi:MAG: heme-copper oxidase subunit III [Chroococcidiopsidaceae cyanobacterium CP_BM_RX_35]|nr:heme-copper oxidase subunit III [Chroococcidiopsidaceae cyanobacterium CP_BM_RX_35]